MTHAGRLPAVLVGIVAAGLAAAPAAAASPATPAVAGSMAVPRAAARPVAAAQAATWSAAVALTGTGAVGSPLPPPAVGMVAAGDAAALFRPPTATGTVAAAFRPAGAGWSGAVQVSPSGVSAGSPVVAVAPDGTAVAAWAGYAGSAPEIDVAFRAPGAGFGAPVRLATGQTLINVLVGIDASDRATLAYTMLDAASHRHLYAVTGTAAGLSAPAVLSPAGQDVGIPALAVNEAGQAVITWQVASPDPNAYGDGLAIEAIRYAPGAGWSAPVAVETGTDLWNGGLALDGRGDALATWTSGPIDWTVPNEVRVATGAPSGTWGAGRTVSGTNGAFTAPYPAVDRAGDAVVAWQTYLGGSGSSAIDAVTRPGASGAFTAPAAINGTDTNPLVPLAAAAPDGSLFVVSWGGGGFATAVPGGAFAAPTILSGSQYQTATAVAAAPGSRAAAVWDEPMPGRHNYAVAASTLN